MNRKNSRTFAGLMILISIIFLSCSKKNLGYGIILWSDNESLYQNGQNISVISESELADVYLISSINNPEPYQIERWRVAFFEDLALAKEKSKSISEFNTIYARNLKDGLLIRKEPGIDSERAYKLRKDQILKVYGRTKDISTIGQYEGYWYQVITEEGISGYCFDHYLDIYDSSINPEKIENPAEILIQSAFSQIYHPSNFIKMIKNSAINLNELKPQTGLFPDLENKNLKIVTKVYSINFPWDTPNLVDKRSFSIGDDGLIVHVLSNTRLQLVYYYEDQKVITTYQVIEDIEDIILAESERREAMYNSLLEAGTNFSSNAYGNIVMQIGGNFSWTNYDRLVPQIIPAGSEGTGRIRFDKFISTPLEEEYSGIITFNFKYGERTIAINFLYSLDGKRLRLTYVPENDINDLNIVSKKSISPVVIAFSTD
jgi:SH3 domain-containing protein